MRKLANEELNRLNIDEFKKSEKIPLVIVLENVRSALNVGSVFRSADGFLLEEVILCGYTATPPNKEIHKTALGATDTVSWRKFESASEAINKLKENGYKVYAAEQVENAIMLNDFHYQLGDKLAIVFGNEVYGVEQETIDVCDGVIEIPQFGAKHSLNIAVSAGIMIWHVVNQHLKKKYEK